MDEIIDVIENARGGWSMLLANGSTIGNYSSRADAERVARWNGYTQKKTR